MPRNLLAVVFASLVLLTVVACGGDDDTDSPSDTPTPIASASATATPEETDDDPTETPEDTGEAGKTPAPTESEGATEPAQTAPGEVPTPGPTAEGGTPALEVGDISTFLSQFQGKEIDYVPCGYNPGTARTNCAGELFAIDPPIVGQDINCTLWIVEAIDQAIACTSVEPSQTRYYDIQ